MFSRVVRELSVIAALILVVRGTLSPSASVRRSAPVLQAYDAPLTFPALPEVRAISFLLKQHKVRETNINRLAASIASSARKYKLNPQLLAAIVVVESRGNPLAVSERDAIGAMQIHRPTWGEAAEREDLNLFRIEDNIDFGTRILQNYIQRFGVSNGIRRYNGLIPGKAKWERSSRRYLAKVQSIYQASSPVGVEARLVVK